MKTSTVYKIIYFFFGSLFSLPITQLKEGDKYIINGSYPNCASFSDEHVVYKLKRLKD